MALSSLEAACASVDRIRSRHLLVHPIVFLEIWFENASAGNNSLRKWLGGFTFVSLSAAIMPSDAEVSHSIFTSVGRWREACCPASNNVIASILSKFPALSAFASRWGPADESGQPVQNNCPHINGCVPCPSPWMAGDIRWVIEVWRAVAKLAVASVQGAAWMRKWQTSLQAILS